MSLLAAPATTVIVPESPLVRVPLAARMLPLPTTRPVNTVLVAVAALRSDGRTPPSWLATDQVDVGFPTKLFQASRVIANAVTPLPEGRFRAPMTLPEPLEAVSTRTFVAKPAISVSVPRFVVPAVIPLMTEVPDVVMLPEARGEPTVGRT